MELVRQRPPAASAVNQLVPGFTVDMARVDSTQRVVKDRLDFVGVGFQALRHGVVGKERNDGWEVSDKRHELDSRVTTMWCFMCTLRGSTVRTGSRTATL